jgi:hypothetical protein
LGSIVIFNIGNRDIQVKREFTLPSGLVLIEGTIDNRLAREVGEQIFNYVRDLKQNKKHNYVKEILCTNLEYPMFEKVMKDLKGDDIDFIYLITSNQAGEYNYQDTIYYGQILESYINTVKGNRSIGLIPTTICKVRVISTDKNPADLDDMNEFFKGQLDNLRKMHKDADRVFLCVSGGTQAMNAMMLINGVDVFKHRLEVLYVLPHKMKPIYLQVGQDMLRNLIKERLISAVVNMDFNSGVSLLEDNASIFNTSIEFKKILHALKYARARVSFDFDQADEEIKHCITYSTGQQRNIFSQLQEEIQFDGEFQDLKYFLELKDNAKYHACRGEYIDFLGRMFRMQEASYYLLAEAVGIEKTGSRPHLNRYWVLMNEELSNYLNSYKTPNGSELQWDRELNRTVLEAVLLFFAKRDEKLQELLEKLKSIDKLAELRNQSPLAHGYRGASKRIVEQEYGAGIGEILLMLDNIADEICRYMKVSLDNSIFYKSFITNLLDIVERL